MKTRTKWLIGGVIVVVLGMVAISTGGRPSTVHPAPHKVPRRVVVPRKAKPVKKVAIHSKPPKPIPNLPVSASHAGSMLSSYEAVSHNPAPANSIQTATDPVNPQEMWALVPDAVHEGGNATATLWFGVQSTPNSPWTWIPSALPGALSSQLPAPAKFALQWAYDLSQKQPGPANLPGVVSWQSIAGAVSMPQGWTMKSVSAENSATGTAAVQITVWQRSYYGSFHGLYGMISDWDSQNLSGAGALNMIEPSTESLNTVTSAAFLKQ